jgi:hypothetical protein
LNTTPKYVASTTLADPEWPGTTVLSDDLAADLVLLENDFVDEMNLLIGHPRRRSQSTGDDARCGI